MMKQAQLEPIFPIASRSRAVFFSISFFSQTGTPPAAYAHYNHSTDVTAASGGELESLQSLMNQKKVY